MTTIPFPNPTTCWSCHSKLAEGAGHQVQFTHYENAPLARFCEKCYALGDHVVEYKTCKHCNGTGERQPEDPSANRHCWVCHGKGTHQWGPARYGDRKPFTEQDRRNWNAFLRAEASYLEEPRGLVAEEG